MQNTKQYNESIIYISVLLNGVVFLLSLNFICGARDDGSGTANLIQKRSGEKMN